MLDARTARRWVVSLVFLCAAAPAGSVPPGEWHAYGRDPGGVRHSPLGQITPANVSRLSVAWTYRTGELATYVKDSDVAK